MTIFLSFVLLFVVGLLIFFISFIIYDTVKCYKKKK